MFVEMKVTPFQITPRFSYLTSFRTSLQHEVSDLIDTTLKEREREIIRLYYGLHDESLTWEEISKR